MILKKVRVAFPHLFVPYAYQNGPNPKYEATLLIEKDDPQLEALKKACGAAKAKKFGDKPVKELHNPIREGDDMNEMFEGYWVVRAKSTPREDGTGKPGVVLPNLQPAGPDDIQSGDFVNVDINPYGYDVSGNKGIGIALNNVQLIMKGDRIGSGKSRPENVFDELEMAGAAGGDDAGGETSENWF